MGVKFETQTTPLSILAEEETTVESERTDVRIGLTMDYGDQALSVEESWDLINPNQLDDEASDSTPYSQCNYIKNYRMMVMIENSEDLDEEAQINAILEDPAQL